MKRLLALLAGFITTVIIAAITVLIETKTDFAFESFFFFFIIPVGSIIIGVIAASAYAITIKKLNQKKTKIDYIIALGLGIVSAFLIYFAIYHMTYITDEGSVMYSFTPITNTYPLAGAEFEDGSVLTFPRYMFEDINHRQISFSYHGKSVGTTPPNAIVGWIHFIIELLGYIIGGMVAIDIFVSTKFCENCAIYYRKNKEEVEVELNQNESINKINEALLHHQNIKEVLADIPKSKGKLTMKLWIESCEKCGDGVLHITFHMLKKDGEQKELSNTSQKIDLKHYLASTPFSLKEHLEKIQKTQALA